MTSAVATLYRSTVGRKIAMAASGLLIVGWLFMHMVGNLLLFAGAEVLNAYGEFLQHGTHGAIWVMRAALLAALVIHVVSAVSLVRLGAKARPVGYQGGRAVQSSTAASRSMRYGGVVLLLYVVYHVMHFTIGNVHSDFVRGDVYGNLVKAFQNPVLVVVYLTATLFLGLHLYHGVASGLQTLGFDHPRWNTYKRNFGGGLAVIIVVGFGVVPLAIISGLVN